MRRIVRPFIWGNSTILLPGVPSSRNSKSLPEDLRRPFDAGCTAGVFCFVRGDVRLRRSARFIGSLLSANQSRAHHRDMEAQRKTERRKTLPRIHAEERGSKRNGKWGCFGQK